MPCGRAVREEAHNPENRNVPDRSVSDARRHIIDRHDIYAQPTFFSFHLSSPSLHSLSPVSLGGLRLGRDASRWLSRASLARRGPEKPNLKTHTDNWG